ncbi:hypothetical protein J7L87_04315, partial [bacterium]|nr:hypothetical protein [bacterium]
MGEIKVLIIVTSETSKTDRVAKSENVKESGIEWIRCWGFEKDKNYAMRLENEKEAKCYASLKEIINKLDNRKRCVIWINGFDVGKSKNQKNEKCPRETVEEDVKDLIMQLKEKGINLANLGYLGHLWEFYGSKFDVKIEEVAKDAFKGGYSMFESDQKAQILQQLVLEEDFNKAFEEVLNTFFFKPEYLIHRIVHLFLPLDIDLMGLKEVEESKKVDYLKEIMEGNKGNTYYRK